MLEVSSNPTGRQVAAIDLDHPRQHDPIKDMPHEMGTVGETVAKRNVDASADPLTVCRLIIPISVIIGNVPTTTLSATTICASSSSVVLVMSPKPKAN